MGKERFIYKLFAAAATIVAAAGCVYPFDPVLPSGDTRLVVEGTIEIGAVSTFKTSRVLPLGSDLTPSPVSAMGYIEGEDGTKISGSSIWSSDGKVYGDMSPGTLYFDTSAAPADQKYRLHLELPGERFVCESDWLEVSPAPVIDELRYILDWDRDELNVALSMHCNGSSRFRWYFDETWEYHTILWASHYLDYSKMYNAYGMYTPSEAFIKYEAGENNYYCWKTVTSPNIKIFSTADQVDDRFTDLEFHRVMRGDDKLETAYRLRVYLQAMSDEAYLYWHNIQQVSNEQGSIMSPVPSQMRGNIHCTTDPSVEVIGYVSAAQVAVGEMYYVDLDEKFYNGTPVNWREVEIVEMTDPQPFALWYARSYLPYTLLKPEMGSDVTEITWQWAPSRCVDCRLLGGTKTKPKGWPNNHN